ncbi:MAG TPA: MlaD family protein, partial [Actinomycetota bacterium]|nr:MlaD family protein [Actinomycetota bacterium]
MTPGRRVKINMVAFLFLSLGFVYWLATQVLSSLQDRYQVVVQLDDAGGVFTSQEVTYRGITVGSVGDMAVIPDGVEITLDINAATKIPKENIEARVMFKSAVGEQFVDLLPASDGPPYLQDNDVIPKEQTAVPVSTQELLTTVEAVLRGVPPEDLKGAVDALGIGLTGRGPDLATIIESTAELAEVFAESGDEFEGILRNGTEVGAEFLKTKEDFASAIHDLVAVSDTLADSTPDLKRLMEGGNLTSQELVRLLRENNKGVNQFLRDFGEINAIQARHSKDLSELLRFLPPALFGVVDTFETDTGLVRFSLVNDTENPACSYGTPRRAASDRSRDLPPKNARCEQQGQASDSASDGRSLGSGGSGAEGTPLIPGLEESLGAGDGPVLPQNMSEWSWT